MTGKDKSLPEPSFNGVMWIGADGRLYQLSTAKRGSSRVKTKEKSLTTRALVNKLDRVFSRYVRLRDADEGGTVRCVTCGKLAHWKEVHAGHFVKRQHMAVRFHEWNVHPQCVRCNLHMGGCQDEYAGFISATYGTDALTQLLAAKREVKKWTREELESLIADYSAKVKTLELRQCE